MSFVKQKLLTLINENVKGWHNTNCALNDTKKTYMTSARHSPSFSSLSPSLPLSIIYKEDQARSG